MQIFGFRNEGDFEVVRETFINNHPDWKVVEHDRDRHTGYPAACVSRLCRETSTLNFHYLSVGEVVRVAEVVK
jgi:hypothetical protein